MPLINGQKMACAPCIRGHRSTKCTHANERLMVPVRKPGRPLSSCPHPSSRPCACAAVTAAIPRKQKCRCGTSDDMAAGENQPDHDASSATAATPPSPSKLGNAGFRVQKQSAKAGPARKQSVDLTGLQRMDASQINIVPPHSATSPQLSSTNGSSTPVSDMALYGSMAMTPSDRPSHSAEPGIFPIFPYGPGSMMALTGQTKTMANGQTSVSTNGAANSEPEMPRSCCGGRVNGAKGLAKTAPVPVDASDSGSSSRSSSNNNNNNTDNTDIEPTTKRCCSSSAPAPAEGEIQHGVGAMPPPLGMPFPPNHGIMMAPFPYPVAMANGMYPFYAQPNIFNYPPQYGSYMQPLQPEQWRHFMAAMAFGPNGGGQPFGMAGPFAAQQQQTPTTPNGSSWTSHQCSCGDACQCIGCAAHPYNDATQDYVRSAWNLMKEESQNGHGYNSGSTPCHDGSVDGADVSSGACEEAANPSCCHETTTPNKANHDGGAWSPAAGHTPSDTASGMGEEQALSASDFFFVSYPFGDSCAGDTVSCPCGDDCQCIGCAIHSNPGRVPNTDDEPR
ncbi:hypothetical protein E4U41_002470 [Claviceps citrina]|nr:hypothetical protein E4U41_002470 [Claviceps citrina]